MLERNNKLLKSLVQFLILLIVLIPVMITVHELGHVIASEWFGAESEVVYIFGGDYIFSGITHHEVVDSEIASTIISLSGGYFIAFVFTVLYFCMRPSTLSAQILMPFIIFQQLVYGTFEGFLGWPEVKSQWIILNTLYGIILLIIVVKKTHVRIDKQKLMDVYYKYIHKTSKPEVIKNIKEV